MLFFGSLEARSNQVQISFRGLDTRFRFLLEYVQDIHVASESNGIDSPICVAVEIIDNFKNSRTAETPKGFRGAVLSSLLCHVKRKPDRILDLVG
jgi:hypothetical protein